MGRWQMLPYPEAGGGPFTVRKGTELEVTFEVETSSSLRDCWLPATVRDTGYRRRSFLVEYQQPGACGGVILRKAWVADNHIRPSPPHLRDKKFALFETVDAYYDFGWWTGVITKELADNRYSVFINHTKKAREFEVSELRPHLEWKGSVWFKLNTHQDDMDGRNTLPLLDEQIEHTTPSVNISVMKRTEQKNHDSNDNASPHSKKQKDEITNDDSVSQSEDVDYEVFSRTKNPSSGKKTHSQEQKGITKTDSPRKRGKPKASDIGSKVDSIETRTQEIVWKTDMIRGSVVPVIVGLQRSEILQKPSTQKTANLPRSDTQQSVPFSPLTGSEGDGTSVAPKRKRGRPPKLRVSSPMTPVASYGKKNVPSELSTVKAGEKVVGSTPSLVTMSLEEQLRMQSAPLSKGALLNENTGQDLSVQPGQGMEKNTVNKGKRGKRRTISINTESPAQDSQDASKDKNLKNDSVTRIPEASVGKSVDTASDDNQPLSKWFEGKHVDPSSKVSERRLDKNLPFVKSTSLWKTLESSEAFRMLPQTPHFRPLERVGKIAREGLAIGAMVTFSTVYDKTCGLKMDEPKSTIEDCLEALVELETHGFQTEEIRQRLSLLLLKKESQESLAREVKLTVERIEESREHVKKVEEEIEDIDGRMRELVEKRKRALLKKEKGESEFAAIDTMFAEMEENMRGLGAEFAELVAAPW